MNETLFYQLLNIARKNREHERPWMKLRRIDSSQTASSADNFETAKTMPSDFSYMAPIEYDADGSIVQSVLRLIDSSGDLILDYEEIPLEQKHRYKKVAGKFYVDHRQSKFYLTGGVLDRTYTIHLFYIHNPGDIAKASSLTLFPDEFYYLLCFDVAAVQKGGIDFDDINARMAPENRAVARAMYSSIIRWDSLLQLSARNQ